VIAGATALGALLPLVSLIQAQGQKPTFSASAEAVRLDVLATARGVPLVGLTADDFEVRDNGVVQDARLSPAASLHWDVVVLFDVSQSVEGTKLEALRASARATAAALRPGDRIALLTFSDAVARPAPLATSGPAFREALDTVRAGGSTALFDALFTGLAMSRAGAARPLLLLFSDGRDTVSWLSADDVLAVARSSDASIYAVSTSPVRPSAPSPPTWASVAQSSDDEFLGRITRETGGRLLHAESGSEVQARVAEALAEIGARYVLSYEPRGAAGEGWHQVQVRLRRRRGTVVVRPGYYRPPSRAKAVSFPEDQPAPSPLNLK